MGFLPDDFELLNVAPYVFVESGGSNFVAPFSNSSLGPFNAVNWSNGITSGNGKWLLVIDQQGAFSSTSIGTASLQFCGLCVGGNPS
jgi:hypothetical protein